MSLDHFQLEPIERLIEAVDDLEPISLSPPLDPVVEFGPREIVELAAATSELKLFVHALATAQTYKLDPEMATGRSDFAPLFSISMLMFCADFEPFGGVWPNPTAATVDEWVRHWRYCHRLEAGTDAALAQLRRVVPPTTFADGESRDLQPLYMVTIRGSDLARAEEVVRACHERQRTGQQGVPLSKWLRGSEKRPGEAGISGQMLTTVETAGLVKRAESTVKKWRMQGTGPPFHKMTASRSGGVYYLRDEVEAWLREHRGRD